MWHFRRAWLVKNQQKDKVQNSVTIGLLLGWIELRHNIGCTCIHTDRDKYSIGRDQRQRQRQTEIEIDTEIERDIQLKRQSGAKSWRAFEVIMTSLNFFLMAMEINGGIMKSGQGETYFALQANLSGSQPPKYGLK